MDEVAALGPGEAFFYGLLQGLTEFLPVSSSGHLALAHRWGLSALPRELELAFDVLLHVPSLLAIAVAFRHEILAALRCGPRFWAIGAVAVVPAGLFGLFGREVVEAAGARLWIIGLCYCWTAALLIVSQRRILTDAPPARQLEAITWRQALLVGVLQAPALLPGVSRSGSTVAGGLLGGLAPQLAVGFAFLVGLPLLAAAALKDALDPEAGFRALLAVAGWLPLSVAFVTSLIASFAAIGLLKLMVGRGRLSWFAGYCLLLAVLCFIWEWY